MAKLVGKKHLSVFLNPFFTNLKRSVFNTKIWDIYYNLYNLIIKKIYETL